MFAVALSLPFAGTASARQLIGAADIAAAMPAPSLPRPLACADGHAGFVVADTIDWSSMRGLKRDLALAMGAGKCRIEIMLSSRGGLVIPALGVAWFLRDLPAQVEIATIVPPGASCDSACTILFAAGTRRTAARDATFLFHPLEVQVLNPALEPLVPRIREEMTQYWLGEVRRADPMIASLLARRDVVGGTGPLVLLSAEDVFRHGKGWVQQLAPGCAEQDPAAPFPLAHCPTPPAG